MDARPSGAATALKTADYIHFMISQALCGLVAATLTFFLVTLASVRACYPRLIGPLSSPRRQISASSRVSPGGEYDAVIAGRIEPSPLTAESGTSAIDQYAAAAAQDAAQLNSLGRRVWIYFGVAVAVPFLAVTLLVGFDEDRAAISGLGLVGLVGFALSFWLALAIRNDAAALAVAIHPAGTSLAGDSQSSDSYWTGSRG